MLGGASVKVAVAPQKYKHGPVLFHGNVGRRSLTKPKPFPSAFRIKDALRRNDDPACAAADAETGRLLTSCRPLFDEGKELRQCHDFQSARLAPSPARRTVPRNRLAVFFFFLMPRWVG